MRESRHHISIRPVPSTERPSPPQNLAWQNQNKSSVQLSWETPLSNGGSVITGYILERCEDGSDKWLRCNTRLCSDLFFKVRFLGTQSKFFDVLMGNRSHESCFCLFVCFFLQVSGLQYGTYYNYRAFAENAAGISDPSNVIGPLLADDPHSERDGQRFYFFEFDQHIG